MSARPRGGTASATPYRRRSRAAATWGLALLALAYLALMVVTGALPRQRQLVEFEARGVMQESPESVVRVELRRDGAHQTLVRDDEGWSLDAGGALDAEASRRVSMAVQFLNTSAPIRHLASTELAGATPAAFGLDPPALTVGVHGRQAPLLTVHFGSENPEGTAQYMAVDGRDGVHLISRFVGSEWAAVAARVSSR